MAKTNKREEPLFVGIDNPDLVKRNLLESSRDLLEVLKQLEDLKEIRNEKNAKVELMNSALRDIRAQLNKLKRSIPSLVSVAAKVKVEAPVEIEAQKPKAKKVVEKKVKVEPIVAKPKTELERLEDEIAMIESKLKE